MGSMRTVLEKRGGNDEESSSDEESSDEDSSDSDQEENVTQESSGGDQGSDEDDQEESRDESGLVKGSVSHYDFEESFDYYKPLDLANSKFFYEYARKCNFSPYYFKRDDYMYS